MTRATKKNPHESGLRFELDSPAWNNECGESFKQFLEGAGSDEKNQARFTTSFVNTTIFQNESDVKDEEEEYTQEKAMKRAQALIKDLEAKGFNPEMFVTILKQEIASNKSTQSTETPETPVVSMAA